MAIIKLVEPWNVNYLRTQVRDSLMYFGEEAILLQLYHPEIDKNIGSCPRCTNDVFGAENMCITCYGTGLYNDSTGLGGVKDARRAWCVFSDHVVSETLGQRGVLAADNREVQCEAFPLLMEHDIIVRVKCWGNSDGNPLPYTFPEEFVDDTHIALSEGRFYSIDAVTRNSLRTGNRYGQTWEDVIGQKAQCSWLPPRSLGILQYPIQGQSFPAATLESYPVPRAVVEPDTKVVFYPVSQQPSFTYTQTTPSSTWVITHALGHLPSVTIVVGGEEVDADVDYPSLTQVSITFAEPQVGSVELV
jgi:hypothetical protein